jgi:ArsR family transcriptional regulator, zinc-responsive transcriptional repressor
MDTREDLDAARDVALITRAAELLRTLGTAHRLSIILELDRGPRCVHELVKHLGASQSLVSQHLRVLRNSGLVVGTRRGKETVYSLTDDHVGHIARDALSHGSETRLSLARNE